jgi:putative ABC transport system substrate-binding protein
VTGLTSMTPNAATKQLELLKQAVPRATRVAVIWNATNTTKTADWHEINATASRLGVALQSREIRRAADFEPAFAAMRRERPDALMTLVDPLTIANRSLIVSFAAKERLPAMYPLRLFVDSGGLMSYGADVTELFHQAARYVDKILRGARPADLPVEQPTKFETALNVKTARALGFVLPPALQLRVDHVVE